MYLATLGIITVGTGFSGSDIVVHVFRELVQVCAGIFNIMDGNNNLVATSEATTADFRETDSRKCPIAGAHQTWSSFKKDLALLCLLFKIRVQFSDPQAPRAPKKGQNKFT